MGLIQETVPLLYNLCVDFLNPSYLNDHHYRNFSIKIIRNIRGVLFTVLKLQHC